MKNIVIITAGILISLIVGYSIGYNLHKVTITPQKPSQNELSQITLKGLIPDVITNRITVYYTPQQAADELNRYRTNAFMVTITNYRASVSLVDRWTAFDVPQRKEIDNLIKGSVCLSGTYSAGYWRRVITIYEIPIYAGGELSYRKETGLDVGVSIIAGF